MCVYERREHLINEYKINIISHQEWLIPKKPQPPGLPTTKPPPVPQMIPPPPPFPAYLDHHEQDDYSGAGNDFEAAPAYKGTRPPPTILPRWIPWSSLYVPQFTNSKGESTA